jgi:hypothetical protein
LRNTSSQRSSVVFSFGLPLSETACSVWGIKPGLAILGLAAMMFPPLTRLSLLGVRLLSLSKQVLSKLLTPRYALRPYRVSGNLNQQSAIRALSVQSTSIARGYTALSAVREFFASDGSCHEAMRLHILNSFPDSLRAQTPIMAKVVAHPPIINFTTRDITDSFSEAQHLVSCFYW